MPVSQKVVISHRHASAHLGSSLQCNSRKQGFVSSCKKEEPGTPPSCKKDGFRILVKMGSYLSKSQLFNFLGNMGYMSVKY